MTIDVKLPDGTVAHFPDGTPNDVMAGARLRSVILADLVELAFALHESAAH